MKNKPDGVTVIDHPVLQHHLSIIRNKQTEPMRFRRLVGEIARFLAYEATRDLATGTAEIETPMERMSDAPVMNTDLLVVSIMRAGNGMLAPVLDLLPFAKVGHVGVYRDKFLKSTVEYFFKIPQNTQGVPTLVLDPLLATGDTAAAAIQRLKEYGVGPIRLLSLLAAPEGITRMKEHHPDVPVYCVSIERELNPQGYILPGLGDAGDRLYGTSA